MGSRRSCLAETSVGCANVDFSESCFLKSKCMFRLEDLNHQIDQPRESSSSFSSSRAGEGSVGLACALLILS